MTPLVATLVVDPHKFYLDHKYHTHQKPLKSVQTRTQVAPHCLGTANTTAVHSMERLDRNSPITKECIWTIRGTVVHGHGRGGTKLGFPTANVGLDVATTQALLPLQNWVYFGWGCVEGRGANGDIVPEGGPYPLVMSVGYNPHFKDKMLTVEAYFLHKFESDFYGEVVRILSCGAIREQGAFTTLEALIETIRGDCRLAEEKLAMPEFSVWRRHAFLAPLPPSTDPLPQLQTLARPCSL